MKTILKLFGALFLAISAYTADASHLIGGDVYYKYVGDQPGVSNPNTYDIYFVIYRESTGAGLGNNLLADVNIQQLQIVGIGCSYTLVLNNMVRVTPEFTPSDAFDCIDHTAGLPQPRVNIYKERVVLDPTRICDRYRIELLGCCRPLNYTNINNGGNFFFAAELNRRLGENSSPEFLNTPLNYGCKDAFQVYQQNTQEVDGDSIKYELVPARMTAATNVVYQGGWSHLNPVSTYPAFPFTLDQGTGVLTYMSNATTNEVSTFSIVAREYRYDTVLGFWENIGYTSREIQLVVRDVCNAAVNAGVKLDPTAPGTYIDSQGRQVRDYNCLDSSITLTFTLPIECYSLADDGTDFRLTAPNGQPIPIKSLEANCNVNYESETVTVNLYKPLIFNGEYYLYSKVGTDGNTLNNKCGKDLDEFDTIVLKVENCVDPEYEVTHVSVEEDKRNRIHFTVDTIKMPLKYIDFMRVYASADSGATYKAVGNVHMDDSLVLVARDGSPGTEGVDRQYYHYRIQMIAGGQELHVSNDYHTIHLSGDLSNPQSMPLRWSAFAGPSYPFYNDVRFTVQWGPEKDPGEYDFRNVNDPVFPMPDSSYTLALPDTMPGNYAIRVLTNQDPNGYISESNWIVYNIPEVVPPLPPPGVPVIIPNAFTPGGDGINDEWTIENIESWSSRKVSIFNRWGRMVWSTDQYNNAQAFDGTDNSGNKLPDGVYMYVVELAHGPTSQSEVHNGTLHLVTNQ